jgi:DNA-binding response OmpR family regulator
MLIERRLLLVEDEALVAQTLEEALGESGFAVHHANSGAAGLIELEQDSGRFIALMTDIRLQKPGPDGFELARRARELQPTIPVVYMSGDSAIEWLERGVPNSIMLQKPFAISQLLTAVSNLLAQEARQR